ncbi:MAG TPA: transporter, partial [Alphaproteobacteria bacterium]|nr:transporter [Alphaproteobacteria bacterium]
ENGRNPFPNGLNASDIGNLPPKGFYVVNELIFFTADRFNNGKGDKLFPDFSLDVFAYAPRFLWNTGVQVLGGDVNFQFIQPVVYQSFENNFVFPPPGTPGVPPPGTPGFPPSPPFGSEDDWQLADFILSPIISWHAHPLHWAVGMDIVFPTGSFADQRLVNAGQNYFTLSPALAVTFYPIEGLHISGKVTLDINFENKDTNYDSGNAVLTDFATVYTVPTAIGGIDVGVGGYTYNQISDDSLNGNPVGDGPGLSGRDGFRGQAYGLGPVLGYRHPSGFRIEAKAQRDFGVENRPEGSRYFLRAFIRL